MRAKSDEPARVPGANDRELMLIEERRQHILSLVQKDGRVLVSELAQRLRISQITIRKDLEYLQSRGLVQRTHGGALPPQSGTLSDPSFPEKQDRNSEQKRRIAAAAAEMVEEGQCIILDSGTTTMRIAQALKRFAQLTVVTNAINIAAELTTTDFDVILTGGTLRKNSHSLVGPLAEDLLAEMHADILFLGVDGFDAESGVTTPNVQESRVNRAMVKCAKRVIVVCDSTKFSRRSFSRIVPTSAIHHVITDRAAPDSVCEALRNQNIGLTLV
jgi:DeoR family transcriptional regulator of aga operon